MPYNGEDPRAWKRQEMNPSTLERCDILAQTSEDLLLK